MNSRFHIQLNVYYLFVIFIFSGLFRRNIETIFIEVNITLIG